MTCQPPSPECPAPQKAGSRQVGSWLSRAYGPVACCWLLEDPRNGSGKVNEISGKLCWMSTHFLRLGVGLTTCSSWEPGASRVTHLSHPDQFRMDTWPTQPVMALSKTVTGAMGSSLAGIPSSEVRSVSRGFGDHLCSCKEEVPRDEVNTRESRTDSERHRSSRTQRPDTEADRQLDFSAAGT